MVYEDLRAKRVLVTGGSSGIGAATARMFGGQGCFVGVHYFATKQGAQEVLKKVSSAGGDGVLLRADVRCQQDVKKMVKEFADCAGGIDVLVNNAGGLIERQSFEEATVDYHDDVFATNVRSVMMVTQAALCYLKDGGASVVNIGSLAAHTGGGPGAGMYAAAKAAVHCYTAAMAKEFSRYQIRVNTISPGFIETRFHYRYSTAERRAKMPSTIPLGRNGTAEDVAKAILFMASEQSGYITGECLSVNGGLEMSL